MMHLDKVVRIHPRRKSECNPSRPLHKGRGKGRTRSGAGDRNVSLSASLFRLSRCLFRDARWLEAVMAAKKRTSKAKTSKARKPRTSRPRITITGTIAALKELAVDVSKIPGL